MGSNLVKTPETFQVAHMRQLLKLFSKCKDHLFDSNSSFPQVSPTISTKCDIIFQDKVNANMNMTYGSSTVSFDIFFVP